MDNKPRKILMATMGMDIGGAETHIVELSKALSRRGHLVTVASNGGVYVGELERAGIRHVSIPMHRRSVPHMVKSYFALKKLISREDFDLVHAHARIPSFLCGMVRKTKKFPFVTSAHGVFPAGGLVGKLTNWGQKTIAVSEDIKTYLMESYGVNSADIIVSINGIDMERFSPEISGERVRQEFAIAPNAPVICHVSRLSQGRTVAADLLIDLAPRLAEAFPGIRIMITGTGDCFEQIKERADRVNAALERHVVIMTGPRTDVNEVLAASTVFVGLSRSCMEAMSTGIPAIVAGDEGYIGLFNKEQLDLCRETNFCCRGCRPSTAEELLAELTACLNLPEAEREQIGAYGRETVGTYYAVETMADDALRAYEAVLRPRRVLLSGYYGFNNAGDEAILAAFLQSADALDGVVETTVLSNAPEQTMKKYGCKAVYRFGIFQVLRAMRRSDVLISGGGSLLQDKSSTRSIVYYLAIIRLAKLMGLPVMLYANGIGPVERPANRRRLRNTVSHADMITLREQSSLQELENMGVDVSKAHVTADPIFLLESVDETRGGQVLKDVGVNLGRPIVGISVRNLGVGEGFVEQMAQLGDYLSGELRRQVVFIVMQTPHDVAISQQIIDKMKNKACLLGGELTPEELIGACGMMDLVITMRLHTMLFAAKARVPVIGLVCDPKIEYFLEKLHMPSGGTMDQFDPKRLGQLAQTMLSDHEAQQIELDRRVSEMEARVGDNTLYLRQLMDGE